jgi:hypothetical protein
LAIRIILVDRLAATAARRYVVEHSGKLEARIDQPSLFRQQCVVEPDIGTPDDNS